MIDTTCRRWLPLLTALLLAGTAWAEPPAAGGMPPGADPDVLEGNPPDPDALEGALPDPDALEGAASAGTATAAGPIPADVVCERDRVCVERGTRLPLRVLPRPFSHLYKAPQADKANILKANVPAFHPWFVFAREGLDLSDPAAPKGWYRVGASEQAPEGWMRAADVFEWRQALTVAYTHPGDPAEGRRPVLMFRDRQALESLIDSDDPAEAADALYSEIDQGRVPEAVVSMEPKRFVDINEHFYLLPILQFDTVDLEGDEARLLQIAAAVPGARGPDTLTDADYAGQARAGRGEAAAADLEKLQVDVVFVFDTTRSMQPYIDITRDAMQALARRLGKDLRERVRFGLIGYRDSLKRAPGLEYETRLFTPELVDAATLAKVLAQAKAARVGSGDYQEEVFAGVDRALSAPWREESLRFVILVGDASSHPRGHEQNLTGKGADDLLRQLTDNRIHLVALHLKDPRAAKDHPLAERQFRTLSRVRGSEEDSAYYAVDAFQKQEFEQAMNEIADRVSGQLGEALAKARKGEVVEVLPESGEAASADASGAGAAFDKAWSAALVEYLGQEAEPPKDIVAWVLDRDLVDPTQRALEVRVLITRDQLGSLVQALDRVIQAMMRAEVTQEQFFKALQGVAGQTMKRPEAIGQAQRLVDTGLLPAFIASLPYKSDILALTDEMYASMTADDQARLQWSLLAKLKQYREIEQQVDAWRKLNESDDAGQMVYPLNLDYLP